MRVVNLQKSYGDGHFAGNALHCVLIDAPLLMHADRHFAGELSPRCFSLSPRKGLSRRIFGSSRFCVCHTMKNAHRCTHLCVNWIMQITEQNAEASIRSYPLSLRLLCRDPHPLQCLYSNIIAVRYRGSACLPSLFHQASFAFFFFSLFNLMQHSATIINRSNRVWNYCFPVNVWLRTVRLMDSTDWNNCFYKMFWKLVSYIGLNLQR